MIRTRSILCSRVALGTALLAAPAAAHGEIVNFVRTVVVSPVPGSPVASGLRLRLRLGGIAGASSTNPYLLKLEPGIYDLGDHSLALKPWVDVEGSGEGVTTVRSTVDAVGTIRGAAHAELRGLTVANEGPTDAVALSNDAPTFAAAHVTCQARGGSRSSSGFVNHAQGGRFRAVTASATGSPNATGAYSQGGVIDGLRARAVAGDIAYAVFNASSEGELHDVTAEAISDRFAGAVRNEGGAPLLRGLRAYSKGADIGDGVVNGGGTQARILDAVIQAVGGTSFAQGVRNEFSSASVSGASITVEAPTSAYGVSSFFSGSPTLQDVSIHVTAAGGGIGVWSSRTVVTVERSVVEADGFSIANEFGEPASAIRVGGSRLSGPVQPAAGSLLCAASHDGAFVALGGNCLP